MEQNDDFPFDLADISSEASTKRETCTRCRRPVTVCWCAYLPRERIQVQTKVIILQHPFEESRTLRTAPMIEEGLEEGKCQIIRGKHFNLKRHPSLGPVLSDPHTLLLYPGADAVDLASLPPSSEDRAYQIVLLDGTWPQARGMYNQNRCLHALKRVQLTHTGRSEYVVRTQPREHSLSTVETAVIALSVLERHPEIVQPLLEPLRALCAFQLSHGAVRHQSKEYLEGRGTGDGDGPVKCVQTDETDQSKHRRCDDQSEFRNCDEQGETDQSEHRSCDVQSEFGNCDEQGETDQSEHRSCDEMDQSEHRPCDGSRPVKNTQQSEIDQSVPKSIDRSKDS